MCANLYSLRNFNVNFVFKDGKIEAEDFTSRLYRELNSSPQPYLVPFLKVIRSPLRVPSVAGGGRRAPLGRGGLGRVSPVCLQLSSPQDRLLSFVRRLFYKFRDPPLLRPQCRVAPGGPEGPCPLRGRPMCRRLKGATLLGGRCRSDASAALMHFNRLLEMMLLAGV